MRNKKEILEEFGEKYFNGDFQKASSIFYWLDQTLTDIAESVPDDFGSKDLYYNCNEIVEEKEEIIKDWKKNFFNNEK